MMFPISLGSLSGSAAEEGELCVNEFGDGGRRTGESRADKEGLVNSA